MKPIHDVPLSGLVPARLRMGWITQMLACGLLTLACAGVRARAQTPNTAANIERPLRYRPDGPDFLIENGTANFNRPLYGPHTAFRVDASDRPDFAFHLPGKGGRLQLGFVSAKGSNWLTRAERVIARYRPGSMVYEVVDQAIGDSALKITVLPLKDSEGLVLSVELMRGGPVELVWAFGGVTGGAVNDRGGDLLGGRDPGAAWNFQAADYAGAACTITGATFAYTGKGGLMNGVGSPGTRLLVGDAARLDSVDQVLASKGADRPVLLGRATVQPDQPVYLLIQRGGGKVNLPLPDGLAFALKLAERARQAVVGQIEINTPDPFINASADAMAVSADALWQAPTLMHGNGAWRTPLLGWRGPYVLDDFGWHDRARQHLEYWAAKQNTGPGPDKLPPADEAANLARNEAGLHSNGDLSNSHYDMNLVYIDALFRHLLWTGDLEFARKMWPVLQRHLAWEKRLFDRDGLYEAYAAIWASDGLYYGGGGATHASAYNLFHNRMAARIAKYLGQDPAPYEHEADWIADALQHDLWLPDRGWYGEYKDLLGLKRVHPDAALWTVYHAIDSQVPDPFQAYQALRYVDTHLAHIPVRGPGVPAGDWYVLPESDWVPYQWSVNNVVPAEMAHTALAYWQAGRIDEAWKLWKGMTLDAMYMGTTPGNLPNLSQYDVYRRETYRDFGDPTGMMSRGLIEGLFGIVPDALAGELLIRPGFPRDWTYASIRTPDVSYTYRLDNSQTELFVIEPKFRVPMRLRLRSLARGERVAAVQINGQPARWSSLVDAVGAPLIEVQTVQPAARYEVNIRWVGQAPATARPPPAALLGRPFRMEFAPATVQEIFDPQHALKSVVVRDQTIAATVDGLPGNHTIFAHVRQDDLTWWMPVDFEIDRALEFLPSGGQDAQSVRFRVRNNTASAIESWAAMDVGGRKTTVTIRVPAMGESQEIAVSSAGLLPGTIHVRVDLGDAGVVAGDVVNWQIVAPPETSWRSVDLAKVFNDPLPQIFRNEYRSPRSPFVSLSIPKQGLGTWDTPQRTFAVDDSGLRRAAAEPGGLALPSGVSFQLPSAEGAKNAAFTSLWDNYPKEITLQVSGRASHAYLLMAGSTNPMQTQIENAEVIVNYWDGTSDRLALSNPTNWWPIDQDYFTDDYAFQVPGPRPPRVELGTGKVYVPVSESRPAGGAATVLELPLDPSKQIFTLTVRPLANDVVIGLLGLTLAR